MPHPLLHVTAFQTTFAAAGGLPDSPAWLIDLLRLDAAAPLERDEAVRVGIRDMLRHGGYRPTGRGKPASEYLLRAAAEGSLTLINAAVDACNAVSLHSGLPISVVDLDRVAAPLHIATASPGERYVFNASGQEIDLAGLLCVYDAAGPCANAVRDAQRAKTHAGTVRTLSVVWGCHGLEARVETATRWYRDLLARTGADTSDVDIRVTSPGGPANEGPA